MRSLCLAACLAPAAALACWDATVARLDGLCVSVPFAEHARAAPSEDALLAWAPRLAALVPQGQRASVDYSPWRSACLAHPLDVESEGDAPWVTLCAPERRCATRRAAGPSLEAAFSALAALAGAGAEARAVAASRQAQPTWVDVQVMPKESARQLAEVWSARWLPVVYQQGFPGTTATASFTAAEVRLGPFAGPAHARTVARWIRRGWDRTATVVSVP